MAEVELIDALDRADIAPAPVSARATPRSRLVAGLTWATAYQAFELAATFAAMLMTARLIPPGEYGRATAVVAVLAALNTFSFGAFANHALQLPEQVEADWTMHWTAGFYLQSALFVACELFAAAAWFSPIYRNIALLLHLAGVGLLFAWPNQIAITMLYRELNFARLKTLSAICMVAKLTVTIGVASSGHGALGIVLANSVVSCIPFGFDLVVIRGWRPDAGWWRWPAWRTYAAPARFGFQRMLASGVAGVRDALEAAVLPVTLGFGSIGLVSRANALYGTTVGRLEHIVLDTVYPFLPRANLDRVQYGRRALLLVQTVCFMTLPAAVFIALEGPGLSRVLYGQKWTAADPLILPAAAGGALVSMVGLLSIILLASGRTRQSVILDGLAAAMMAAALAGIVSGRTASSYLWWIAGGQLVSATAGIALVHELMPRRWLWRSIVPAVITSGVAGSLLTIAHPASVAHAGFAHVAAAAFLFAVAVSAALRLLFGNLLIELFDTLSWRGWPRRLLLLPVVAQPLG